MSGSPRELIVFAEGGKAPARSLSALPRPRISWFLLADLLVFLEIGYDPSLTHLLAFVEIGDLLSQPIESEPLAKMVALVARRSTGFSVESDQSLAHPAYHLA